MDFPETLDYKNDKFFHFSDHSKLITSHILFYVIAVGTNEVKV